jgi:hypothetical protein
MTRAVDDRGAEASPKLAVPLTASLVSSLIVCGSNIIAFSLPWMAQSLEAFFTVVKWVISAYVLIPISECEPARMRAETTATMPCKLIDCRDPL